VSPMTIGWIVFAVVFGSALLGMFVRNALPEHHLSAESKDVMKLGIALVATMSALVLGLLIASAKSTYDARRSQLAEGAAEIVLLDRALAGLGTQTKDARSLLRRTVAAAIDRFWPTESGARPRALAPNLSPVEAILAAIERVSPQSNEQRALRREALTLAFDVGRTQLLLFENLRPLTPLPFVVVLVLWLCIIFASFGLFAPPNGTVIAVLLVCALSASSAIFMILELDRSFEGLFQVSSSPLRAALAQLGG
jgi:hypothetical protein